MFKGDGFFSFDLVGFRDNFVEEFSAYKRSFCSNEKSIVEKAAVGAAMPKIDNGKGGRNIFSRLQELGR